MSESILFDQTESDCGLYSAAQCREVDRVAIEEHGIPGFDLMSRAGQRAFDILVRELGSPGRLVVLCGPGNNGGDGYIVADLARALGIDVLLVEMEKPRGHDASQARSDFIENGGSCSGLQALPQAPWRRMSMSPIENYVCSWPCLKGVSADIGRPEQHRQR